LSSQTSRAAAQIRDPWQNRSRPFISLQALGIVIVLSWPQLALWLPGVV